MVGVGVAEGGAGPGGGEQYYGEYYPPEQYYVPQEMCAHPQQHQQHAHMCTVHEYGGMPVVTSATMMPPMMPMDESMRHYLVHAPHPHHAHHQPQHQPQHHQPPPPHHHQPQHHYGATNGAGGPQHYYNAGFPAHYHLPPQHMHYQPPPVYQKDERAQRQYSKLKHKLERKQYNNRNNGTGESVSGASTPSLSPRKELNGSRGASSGARSEGESSSASASLHGDDEQDTQALLDLLSATRTPQVSEMSPTTALVQWNSPLPEGVALPQVELTYELLLGDRGRYRAIYSGPKLSCWVCDLRPGCEYSVCLQIRAGELTGAASEAATFRAPAAPPAAPAAPRLATRTRSSLALRWPAAADNGARITHYVLELDAGEGWREVARPRSRQHTVNELRPQTWHRVRLAAVNECGRGDWSDETVAWTAGAPPPQPAPPRLVSAAPTSLALSWDQRMPEDEYTLQAEDSGRGHGFLPVYSGPELETVCANLRRATDYRFRLRCESSDGQGPWSVETTYRTLAERPGPPGRPSLRGKAHSRAFRLRWEPPSDDGGAPVQTYALELDDGGGDFREVYRGPEREAHCDRLPPGAAYRARVRCENEAGGSDWSPVESVSTEPAVPAACPAPELAGPARALHATVRWRAPACSGGADVNEYRVELTEAAGAARVLSAAEPECTLRDLTPGAAYSVAVAACNRVGAGPLSPPLQFTAGAAPPDAPAPPSLELRTPTSALLRWEPPRDNGAPVLDYRLEVGRADEDAFCEVFRGLATERLVSDLTPFTAYFFRVCASNSAGRGAWSLPRDCLTPRSAPGAPPPPRCEPEADALRVSWREPAAHGAPVLRYRLRVDERELEADAAECERRVDGLLPDTVYRVRVAAENELGLGAWSEVAKVATRPPPPEPPHLACVQRAHNHLKLKWGEGGAPEGTQYRLEMRAPDSREFRAAYRGSARCCKVKKLRENTTYAFRIRASDERGGLGAWSEPLEERTGGAPPPAPRTPGVEPAGPTRATVCWDSADDCTYTVQVSRAGTPPAWRQAWAGGGGQCALEELEAGAEYLVRVCAWRGGAAGAWSGAARLALPAAAVALSAAPARRGPRPARRSLARRHAALLLAVGFLALAVVVAWLLQRLVAPRP